MAAKSSKGLKICITKGSATATDLSPTGITNAKPAVVTCTTTNVADGDIVVVSGTGMASLDGKAWVVANKSGTDLELLGSDASADTAATGGKVDHYASPADYECLCLSSLGISAEAPSTVSVATYCDNSATIPGAAGSAGTLDFAGYVDITDTDYAELLAAVEDGKQRYMRIMFPGNGFIVAPLTFSSITWDLPLDGAIAYSGTAVLGSKPKHLF